MTNNIGQFDTVLFEETARPAKKVERPPLGLEGVPPGQRNLNSLFHVAHFMMEGSGSLNFPGRQDHV